MIEVFFCETIISPTATPQATQLPTQARAENPRGAESKNHVERSYVQ